MSDSLPKNPSESCRLVKYLAACGLASRRGAGDLVAAGRVKVNGQICTNMAYQVQANDRVECDGKAVAPEAKHYIMLYKPVGYVCTNDDCHVPLKAIDLITLPDHAKLFSAGRLDKDSEGLIIFANDGAYVDWLTHPSHRVCKRYLVTLDRPLTERNIRSILSGIWQDDELLHAVKVNWQSDTTYEFVLDTGRKREIRRLVEACNAQVRRLCRTHYGHLALGDLAVGKWRELSQKEIQLSQMPD